MTRHHLFGPVPAGFADEYLHGLRAGGSCLTFGFGPDSDVQVSAGDAWADVLGRSPTGWEPELVAVWLPGGPIPTAVWNAPIPLVALAPDWDRRWLAYRRVADRFEVLFADHTGAKNFRESGVAHARPAVLDGLGRTFLAGPWPEPESPRDIDVLFVGSVDPASRRDRLAYLGRLGGLARRHRVVIRTGVSDADYWNLLARSKVVFNHSACGGANRRVFEAVAARAVLLQERGNAAVADVLRPEVEYAEYGRDDLEHVVTRLLASDDERLAIATAAARQMPRLSFEAQWSATLDSLADGWDDLRARAAARPPGAGAELLRSRAALVASAPSARPDMGLLQELVLADAADPTGRWAGPLVAVEAAAGAAPAVLLAPLRKAAAADPPDPAAGVALAELLAALGDKPETVAVARRTLAALDERGGGPWDPPPFPPGRSLVRAEWERAGWSYPSDPAGAAAAQRATARARLHALLARATGELVHYRAAAAARPDLPAGRAALGCALARAGGMAEAVPHLEAAVGGNPFDRAAARALFQALGDAGDRDKQAGLAAYTRHLHQAAPELVPAESWFTGRGSAPAASGGPAVERMSPSAFAERFRERDTSPAASDTGPPDERAIVRALVSHYRPSRLLAVGTATGPMTRDLAAWSTDEATVLALRDLADSTIRSAKSAISDFAVEGVSGEVFVGATDKVRPVDADVRSCNFVAMAPIDLAWIDRTHGFTHFRTDVRRVYDALSPGGVLVWHDSGPDAGRWPEVMGAPDSIRQVDGTDVVFLVKGSGRSTGALTPSNVPPVRTDRPVAVRWEGEVAALHSLALANRSMVAALDALGHEVSVRPTSQLTGGDPVDPGPVGRLVGRSLPVPAAVTVRHRWPPDLSAAAEGRLVLFQPWEYGSVPAAWVPAVGTTVDEVWVPTRYVRQCFIDGGVPADRVQVVPNGVDVETFRPGLAAFPLATRKRFKFLFVGGTIWRKGFDVLLAAYGQAFTAADDVCLVVKDLGAGTFYRGQTGERDVEAFRARPDAPEVEYLTAPLSGSEMAGLYAACDCLVHPYRGEGFGLPVAEAMACGLPVVVTAGGATDDWCDDANSYRIPARRVTLSEDRVGDLTTAGRPWVLEPDGAALSALLRFLAGSPPEAAEKGRAGCATVRGRLTWGHAARAAEARLHALAGRPAPAGPAAPDAGTPGTRRPRVSLTMIVKNEERDLPDCLASVRYLVDEIVVVDTGSTDRTKEVAESFGAKVFDFPWVDHFSDARNAALGHATGDWAFWMDADDRLEGENRDRARALFAALADENAGYVMKCRCLGEEGREATVVDHLRLFRLRPDVRWKYRIHEQILPAVRRAGGQIRWSDVVITHVGYADPATRRRKLDRDLRLLNREYAEQPDDPFTLFNLGNVYRELGDAAAALTPLERSLALSHPKDSIVRKLFALVAQCHRELGRPDAALDTCLKGRKVYPDDEELLFLEAGVRVDRRDFAGAERCLQQLLNTTEGAHFASVAEGYRGHKARNNLACLYMDTNRPAQAAAEWERVLTDHPDFLPARAGLAEVALVGRRWGDVELHAAALKALGPTGDAMAEGVRGRAMIERGEYAAAGQVLRQAIARYPDSLQLWLLLSQAALKEGADGPAEDALLGVLRLAPNHPESRYNLAVLRAQRSLGPGQAMSLPALFRVACNTPTEGRGALAALHDLARQCPHVTVVGPTRPDLAVAVLAAQPARVVWYGHVRPPEFDLLERLATRTAFKFRPADEPGGRFDPTDLLVDAGRAPGDAPLALERVAARVRRYIALVHPKSDAGDVEVEGSPAAAEPLLASGDFRRVPSTGQESSLTVLERARPVV